MEQMRHVEGRVRRRMIDRGVHPDDADLPFWKRRVFSRAASFLTSGAIHDGIGRRVRMEEKGGGGEVKRYYRIAQDGSLRRGDKARGQAPPPPPSRRMRYAGSNRERKRLALRAKARRAERVEA